MSNTKEILEKYNIKLDTNKSQNYLIDDNKMQISKIMKQFLKLVLELEH